MIVSTVVLTLFIVSILGLATLLSHQPHEPDGERRSADEDDRSDGHWDDRSDDQWIAELRALNAAMPRLRKHRARVAARRHP